MTTEDRNVLAIFGDAKTHTVFESVMFCLHGFRMAPKKIEAKLRRLTERGWLAYTAGPSYPESTLLLTVMGDKAFREEQIRLGGDYRYFHYYDRTPEGNDKFGNPQNKFEIDAVRDKLDMSNPMDRQLYHALLRKKQLVESVLGQK